MPMWLYGLKITIMAIILLFIVSYIMPASHGNSTKGSSIELLDLFLDVAYIAY